MEKKPYWVYLVSLLIFSSFIIIAYAVNVRDYVNDSIMMIVLSSLLFFGYHSFRLKPWIYLAVISAFAMHNLGVFGYYNISPVAFQWDHITHLFGEFAAGVLVYNYMHASGFFKSKKGMEKFNLIFLAIAAAVGFGVFVEFIEFIGYFAVGDGLGIFGHGIGDINTEFINNEWFNTMLDLIYNFIWSVIGLIFMRYVLKKF